MTPGSHEDDFLDLVAVLALGALPEGEARRVAAHLETCDACRALYAELRPAADLVGYAAEATELDVVTSVRMKARIMRVVRGEQVSPVRRKPAFAWLAAAAAAILAVAIGADDYATRDRAARRGEAERTALVEKQTQLSEKQSQLSATQAELSRKQSQLGQTQSQLVAKQSQLSQMESQLVAKQSQLSEKQSQLAASKNQRDTSESRLAALLGPDSKHFAVPQGEVVTNSGRVFIAIKVAALPRGKVYQAWTLRKGAAAVAPSLTFSPEASGVAFVELPVDASGVVAVAVSVEPAGGSRAPTSTPKFIRKLS